MKLCFDSVDEVRAFVKDELKGRRGAKSDDGDTGVNTGVAGNAGGAPAPLMPPQQQPGGFAPPGGGASFMPQQQPGGFPGVGTIDPAVAAIVARITARIDGAITAGQPADQVLAWFRTQCGPEATNATLDQIKQAFLAKLPMPSLENIAKLMNA